MKSPLLPHVLGLRMYPPTAVIPFYAKRAMVFRSSFLSMGDVPTYVKLLIQELSYANMKAQARKHHGSYTRNSHHRLPMILFHVCAFSKPFRPN